MFSHEVKDVFGTLGPTLDTLILLTQALLRELFDDVSLDEVQVIPHSVVNIPF